MRLKYGLSALFLALVALLSVGRFLHAQATANSESAEPHVYRNAALGFYCKIPFGWVDRTQQMQGTESGDASSQVLLAVFERPPEATSDTINAGIVIARESTAANPKVKSAREYFEPLAEAASAQGLKAVNDPYEFAVSGKPLVRQDFSKPRGKLTMYQSSLVILKKGWIVSFTFIGGSSDEVDELIQNLNFPFAGRQVH